GRRHARSGSRRAAGGLRGAAAGCDDRRGRADRVLPRAARPLQDAAPGRRPRGPPEERRRQDREGGASRAARRGERAVTYRDWYGALAFLLSSAVVAVGALRLGVGTLPD